MVRSYEPRVANFRLIINDSAYPIVVMTQSLCYSRRRCLTMIGGMFAGLALANRASSQENPRDAPEQFHRYGVDQPVVTLVTRTGHYQFLVAMVSDLENAQSVLIARRRIQPDEGILYINDYVRPLGLSNQGVPFPTDLLFATADGRIIEIDPSIMANDQRVITSTAPVKAALQVIAGTVARSSAAPGDYLLSEVFGRTL